MQSLGKAVLSTYGYDHAHWWRFAPIGFLVFFIVVMNGVTAVALRLLSGVLADGLPAMQRMKQSLTRCTTWLWRCCDTLCRFCCPSRCERYPAAPMLGLGLGLGVGVGVGFRIRVGVSNGVHGVGSHARPRLTSGNLVLLSVTMQCIVDHARRFVRLLVQRQIRGKPSSPRRSRLRRMTSLLCGRRGSSRRS